MCRCITKVFAPIILFATVFSFPASAEFPDCDLNSWATTDRNRTMGTLNQRIEDNLPSKSYDELGWMCMMRGESEEAIKYFTMTLEHADQDDLFHLQMYYHNRGSAYQMNRDYALALQDFDMVIDLSERMVGDEEWDGYYFDEDVVDYYGKKVSIIDVADAILRKAWIRSTCFDTKIINAKMAFDDAIFVVQYFPIYTTYEVLAASLAQLGRYEEAIQVQQKAIAMFKDLCSKNNDLSLKDSKFDRMVGRLMLYVKELPYTEHDDPEDLEDTFF